MKHPGLARVFSIAVAVMSLVMLLAGIMGIGSAVSERDENVRSYEVLEGRVETYEELTAKLQNSPTYKEASTQLEEEKETHRENSDSHKDSLMEYTAAEAIMKESKASLDMIDSMLDQAEYILIAMLNSEVDNLPQYAREIYELLELITAREDFKKAIEEGEIDPGDISEMISDETMNILKSTFKYLGNQDQLYAEDDVTQYLEDIDSEELMSASNTLIKAGGMLEEYVEQYSEGKEKLNKAEIENLKKGIELAVEKYELIKESEEIEELEKANEQLKEDENKLKSTKVHLLKNENIKAATDNGEDIISAAKNELNREKKNYKKEFALRLDANIFMIIGAVAGFLGIPGSFEIKKSRSWLIVPVLVFTVFAAAADGISMYLGRGQMYSALAAAIFGIIQLITIIPKASKMKS